MRLRVLRSAHISILEGFDFYEEQEPGLGFRFFESVMLDIEFLGSIGGGHQIVHKDYRRMVCKKFPFSIYYKVEHSELNVYLVLDNRRDPKLISERLN